MLEKLQQYIELNHLFLEGKPLVVGVSGGLDSMATLFALQRLGYDVICGHFDHRLRPESAKDAAFVKSETEKLGVPFATDDGDVQQFSSREGISLEEAGRRMRYEFLFSTAHQFGAQAVVTGHTSDDQVETVLMHFVRGAGLSGLKGMLPTTVLPTFDSAIPLVRPMLETSRAELQRYCAAEHIEYREDPTNESMTYFRNRLRHKLIPALETYNENFRKVVSRNAKVLQQEDAVLTNIVDELQSTIFLAKTDAYVQIDRKAFLDQPHGLQARLLRSGIKHLNPMLRDIDHASIERAVDAVRKGGSHRTADLVGGLQLLVEFDRAWIGAGWEAVPSDEWPQLLSRGNEIEIPGEIDLADGWYLSAEVEMELPELMDGDGNIAVFDADIINTGLRIRGREPGDRFFPEGMGGHSVKISDFMVNEKLPKRTRAQWPLLVSGDEILWVVGKRLSDSCVPGITTKRYLLVKLLRR